MPPRVCGWSAAAFPHRSRRRCCARPQTRLAFRNLLILSVLSVRACGHRYALRRAAHVGDGLRETLGNRAMLCATGLSPCQPTAER